MQNKEIKILFFGSTDFSLASLISLHVSQYNIVGAVTQPDKPAGRGNTIEQSPVKKWSIENKIKVIQPDKLKDTSSYAFVKELEPDVIVVASYGKILPMELLNIPRFGSVNVHASLLPKYRGASPIQATILSGDSETGVTIMRMNAGMDTGRILAMKSIPIANDETSETLSKKLEKLGADLLVETLPGWITGKIEPRNQEEKGISICKKISKEDGEINWQLMSSQIERIIRAYNPWPSAWSTLEKDGQIVKIHSGKSFIAEHAQNDAGKIFVTDKKNPAVYCEADSALELLSIQPQGKKSMSGRDFILGRQQLVGTFFK